MLSCLTLERDGVVSKVVFMPINKSDPTVLSTIYTTLLQIQRAANRMVQTHVPIYFDMSLQGKALEITLAEPGVFKAIVLCDGGVHVLMSVKAAIGFL